LQLFDFIKCEEKIAYNRKNDWVALLALLQKKNLIPCTNVINGHKNQNLKFFIGYEFVMNFEVCYPIGPKDSLDYPQTNKKCIHNGHLTHL